jgi:uncharacterized membrane protein
MLENQCVIYEQRRVKQATAELSSLARMGTSPHLMIAGLVTMQAASKAAFRAHHSSQTSCCTEPKLGNLTIDFVSGTVLGDANPMIVAIFSEYLICLVGLCMAVRIHVNTMQGAVRTRSIPCIDTRAMRRLSSNNK